MRERSRRGLSHFDTESYFIAQTCRWPGYLDNTVAGGIPSGMGIFDSLVKECMEEASIKEDVVREYVRGTGAVSYFFRTSAGWLQPQVE